MSPEKLGYLPSEFKKDHYLAAGETPIDLKQEPNFSSTNATEQMAPESKKSGENFVDEEFKEKPKKDNSYRTSELLLKIFARDSTESLEVPDSFKSFLEQYANDPFLKNYLQENPTDSNAVNRFQQLEPYRTRKSYQTYINDPFFLFLLYNRFYNNLHYDWQQKDQDQQNHQAQSTEKVLRALGKALFDTRDRYESYVSSHVDANTGLLSRSTFEDYFTYLQNPAVQEKEKRNKEGETALLYGFAFVMIDLDHFKSINDTYGHLIGDEVLKKLSEAFKNSSEIREDDAFFRYAGDEFSLVMPLTHSSSIKDIDSELKQRVFQRIAAILRPIAKEMQTLSLSNQQILNLTLSAGVHIISLAELQENDQGENLREKIDQIVAQADRALYQAKTQRNSLSIKTKSETETKTPENDEAANILEELNQFFQQEKTKQENKDYTIIPLI